MLARTGAEQSATQIIRGTLEDAAFAADPGRPLPARPQTSPPQDALRLAVHSLGPSEAARVLADPAAPHLARALASAAGHGTDPGRLLRAARDLEEMDAVRSPALVLASRIEDHAATLGIPFGPPADAPLPWLPGPDVGHPGWLPYLQARAQLIRDRAQALGSLPAAYRDQYAVTDPTPRRSARHPNPAPPARSPTGSPPPTFHRPPAARHHRRTRDVHRHSHRSDRPCLSSEDLA